MILNCQSSLRKTISVGEEMTPDPINHVVYEVKGSLMN